MNELYVGNTVYKTDTEILEGWHKHFGQLAENQKTRFLMTNTLLRLIVSSWKLLTYVKMTVQKYSLLQRKKLRMH